VRYGSTIRQKTGECEVCANGKSVPLTKGLCYNHYWLNVRMKSVNKMAEKEDQFDGDDVATLKKDLDLIFSRWLRLSVADKKGMCTCYICGNQVRWQDAQAMHFVKRGHSFLRYDTRNVKVGDKVCNEYKDGNLVEYAKKLERENPGITEILIEEGNQIYSFTRQELKDMIADYSGKLDLLKEEIPK
jgi:hypothetical protein